MGSISLTNSISKGSVRELDSLYEAYVSDEASQKASKESQASRAIRPGGGQPGGGQPEEAISNEKIRKNEEILGTYRVLDDAIRGGMGSVWRVHHEGWDTDLAMKRPQPRFFARHRRRADDLLGVDGRRKPQGRDPQRPALRGHGG